MRQERTLTGSRNLGRNLELSNSIFAPTVAAAFFLIGFLWLRPETMTGLQVIAWAGAGSVIAAVIGLCVGYRYRASERLSLVLRYLLTVLMLFLIGYAVYMSFVDFRSLTSE